MLEDDTYIGMPLREKIIEGGVGFTLLLGGTLCGAGVVYQTLDLLARNELDYFQSGMIGLGSLSSLYIVGAEAYEIVHAIKGKYLPSRNIPGDILRKQRSFIDDGKSN